MIVEANYLLLGILVSAIKLNMVKNISKHSFENIYFSYWQSIPLLCFPFMAIKCFSLPRVIFQVLSNSLLIKIRIETQPHLVILTILVLHFVKFYHSCT